MSAALKEHLQGLPPSELDALRIDRWREISNLAGQFGADTDTVRRLLHEIKPKPKDKADRFEWLQAICLRHELGVRALRTAVALFSFAGPSGYLWPSQKSLAQRAGYADDAEVRRGLGSLVAIGSVRKVKVVNLPEELAGKALSSSKDGGSGRSARGTAYALVAPENWSEKQLTGTRCPSPNRDTVSLYNHQVKPLPASPDYFSPMGDPISNVEYADRYLNGDDGMDKAYG
ncbi:helix-turn-helix domain-containing protein [Agrobacterium vitis]|uniref:hypothetical protein n=1 Tax=Agrobacterium vitis TaxID=373 RepID=UPI00157415F0|nr:hypothetical protein [Agrobacterium vitis]NSZ19330.1 hypothetical protein [Agrobacterium vitis]QZO06198.1 hypothetical protein K4831_21355 [Agrobacterium vitis]UJL90521.1 hypothetical protein AVF2S5_21390 [Agrobacterium vitis]